MRERTGSITGRVLLNGRPVFGAHVMAFHLESGEFVGGFTLNDAGEFQIAGLRPGPHVIRVEPLDDADVDSFFEPEGIEINFQPAFYSRVVAVPAGGTCAARRRVGHAEMNGLVDALVVAAIALPSGRRRADAQPRAPLRDHRRGGTADRRDLGAQNGDLRANSTPPQPFTLFTTQIATFAVVAR